MTLFHHQSRRKSRWIVSKVGILHSTAVCINIALLLAVLTLIGEILR